MAANASRVNGDRSISVDVLVFPRRMESAPMLAAPRLAEGGGGIARGMVVLLGSLAWR